MTLDSTNSTNSRIFKGVHDFTTVHVWLIGLYEKKWKYKLYLYLRISEKDLSKKFDYDFVVYNWDSIGTNLISSILSIWKSLFYRIINFDHHFCFTSQLFIDWMKRYYSLHPYKYVSNHFTSPVTVFLSFYILIITKKSIGKKAHRWV
jgi:hypothetical protein